MNPTTITQMMATLSALGAPPEIDNPTAFASMSQEAQDAVVNAMMGEYEGGPPDIPESVKDEIRAWAALPPENASLSHGDDSATPPPPTNDLSK